MALRKDLGASYSPLYWLAALGNGGLSISFFIYLMFMTPHPDTPIPTFNSLQAQITSGNLPVTALILFVLAAVIFFAYRHYRLLIWNIREFFAFSKTEKYSQLRQGNSAVSLMAIPLTLAMSINVAFVLGALFVPNIWTVVEYLFPFALLGFLATGVLALNIFGSYFTHILTTGSFDCTRNNNLSQMIAIFAFAMVAVGFAASSAMSTVVLTAGLSTIGSIFFLSVAALLGVVKFVLGVRAMLEHGIDREGSASLWIIIPILTLVGITFIRLAHGLHHHFDMHFGSGFFLILTSGIISLQLIHGGLGYAVMKKLGYYSTYVDGEGRTPGAYSLICPGVALVVFGMFFINSGLVGSGMLVKFSPAYFLMIAPLALVQIQTIRTMLKLDRKLIRPEKPDSTASTVPA
jgi:hypothetical protein